MNKEQDLCLLNARISKLATQRNGLIDKKYKTGVSAKEAKKIAQLTRRLDDIDNLILGSHLDRMEEDARLYAEEAKNFAQVVTDLISQVERLK